MRGAGWPGLVGRGLRAALLALAVGALVTVAVLVVLAVVLRLVAVGSAGWLTVETWAVVGILAFAFAAGVSAFLTGRGIVDDQSDWLRALTLVTVGGVLLVGYRLGSVPVPGLPPTFIANLLAGDCSSGAGLLRQHDLVLVVDPSSAGGRELVRRARQEPAAFDAIPSEGCGARFAVAAVVGTGNAERRFVLLQALTRDRRRVAGALAASAGLASAGSPAYAATLSPRAFAAGIAAATAASSPVAERGVVLVVDRLPAGPEAAGALELRLLAGAAPALGATVYVTVLLRPAPSTLAAWSRLLPVRPPAPIPIFPPGAPQLLIPGAYDRTTNPLDLVEDTIDGPRLRDEADLAFRLRPVLRLDSGELRRPLDVDAFLAERDAAGRPLHRACTRSYGFERCRPIDSVVALGSSDAGYLKLAVAPRSGRLPATEARLPQRIYFHVAEGADGTVGIDYWWFLSYNDSPVAGRWMCIGGLSLADRTCFDHQGDWEGISVRLPSPNAPPEQATVVYTGHHWRYAYSWQALERVGAVDAGRPVVYVARDSHASYPVGCVRECEQLDFRIHGVPLPDGPADGTRPWSLNDDAACAAARCLEPLPYRDAGTPDSWNAFDGFWGAPVCTIGSSLVCVRGDGPRSPSAQRRDGATPGSVAELERRAAAFG